MTTTPINNPSTPYGANTKTFWVNGTMVQTDEEVDQTFLIRCVRISRRGIAQSGYFEGVCWRIVH